MRVFEEMEGQGIVPDVVAHNAAIAACAKVRACRPAAVCLPGPRPAW